MTEYTSSSEAVREYMSARERTALWVQTHTQDGANAMFLSPSSPPSVISDPDAPSYGPSDSDRESTHSLPPRMVLRYNDGRPDVPITNAPSGPLSRTNRPPGAGVSPQQYMPSHSRSRSGSQLQSGPSAASNEMSRHAQTLSYATSNHTAMPLAIPPPRSPESIVVLPSRQGDDPPQSVTHSSRNPSQQSHSGSRSHSRSASSQGALGKSAPPFEQAEYSSGPQYHTQMGAGPQVPLQHSSHPSIVAPSPRRPFDPTQIPVPTGSPPITYSQSQPMSATGGLGPAFDARAPSSRVQSQLPYTYAPPAIVYAPSSKHSRSRYTPPAIVYSPSATHHPHSRHAPSITYSHSAPLPQPSHRSHAGSTYRSAHGSMAHHPSSAIPEEPADIAHERRQDRSRSRSRSRGAGRGRTPAIYADHPPMPPSRSSSPAESFGESDRGSRTSGSTYYVLPTPGQKVKLIVSTPYRRP